MKQSAFPTWHCQRKTERQQCRRKFGDYRNVEPFLLNLRKSTEKQDRRRNPVKAFCVLEMKCPFFILELYMERHPQENAQKVNIINTIAWELLSSWLFKTFPVDVTSHVWTRLITWTRWNQISPRLQKGLAHLSRNYWFFKCQRTICLDYKREWNKAMQPFCL